MRIELDPNHLTESDQLRVRMIKVKERWSRMRMPRFNVVFLYEHPQWESRLLQVRNTWHMVGMNAEVVEIFEDIVEKEVARRKEEVGLVT